MKNKLILFDLSKEGWKDSLKEFGLSLFKTVLAAGVVFVLDRLSQYQLPVSTPAEYAGLFALAVGVVRALLTSVWVWATRTSASIVPVEQATTTVEAVNEPQAPVTS